MNVTEPGALHQGWVPQPDGRGTLDILTTCISTMFLCSWSILCMNLPSPSDSAWASFRRKIYLTGLGVGGPEFVFQIALGQWASARTCVKAFKETGHNEWTLRHAFFADAGGFVLRTRDWVCFPLDGKQLLYLINKGWVAYPDVDVKVISDKNKTDGVIRLLMVAQTLWFAINCICRAAQGLAITTFELTVLGSIVCSYGTWFCWFHKPADAETPIHLDCDFTMSDILKTAGQANTMWYRTPLDFISREEWSWSLHWQYWVNILRKMGFNFGPKVRPIDRMPNDDFREIKGAIMTPVLIGFQTAYGALNFAAWNADFATPTEQILWRAASVSVLSAIWWYWLSEVYAWRLYPAIQCLINKRRRSGIVKELPVIHDRPSTPKKSYLQRIAARLRNNSSDDDPALTVPLRALLPVLLVSAPFYCIPRVYMLVADVVGLRSLPASAFETVNWSAYIPHLH